MDRKERLVKLKLNQSLRGIPEGKIVEVKVDINGLAIERYWRDRMIDAEIDNCVEIVKDEKPKKNIKGDE